MTLTKVPFAGSIKQGLLATGWYASRLEPERFPGVLTLCYHGLRRSDAGASNIPNANLHVTAATFDAHCRVLADTCHPIDLTAVAEAQCGGRALPDRPVLVTFDDGYRSVFEIARPILRRYRIPAAVFVCSEPVARQRLFWFDAVMRALGTDAVARLRVLPEEGWRAIAAAHDTPAAAVPDLAPMTEDEVRQMADEGFAIGAHTATHAPLAGAPADVQRQELVSCRDALESWTGRRVDAVAYPFGAAQADYTAETVAIAGALGFTAGFTTRHDYARPSEPPLERSRFVMLDAVSAAELAHRIAYAWPR